MAVYERTTGIITIIITVATTVQPRNDQNRKRSITMATCCHSLIISASWSSSSLLATMIFRYLSISSMTVRRLMSGFDVSIKDVVLYSKLWSLPWLKYSCPGLQLPWRPLWAVLLPMFILLALNSATGDRLFMWHSFTRRRQTSAFSCERRWACLLFFRFLRVCCSGGPQHWQRNILAIKLSTSNFIHRGTCGIRKRNFLIIKCFSKFTNVKWQLHVEMMSSLRKFFKQLC